MFRFSTLDGAAAALAAIERDYRRHCRAAREIAETYFDARAVLARVATLAVAGSARSSIDGGAPRGQRLSSEART